MDDRKIRDAVLEAVELSLEAQLKAVRRLRKGDTPPKPSPREGMSQVDMAYDILAAAGTPLHVSTIIDHILRRFGQQVDRESLVSALTKRVARQDRFERTDKNTFAVREESAK